MTAISEKLGHVSEDGLTDDEVFDVVITLEQRDSYRAQALVLADLLDSVGVDVEAIVHLVVQEHSATGPLREFEENKRKLVRRGRVVEVPIES